MTSRAVITFSSSIRRIGASSPKIPENRRREAFEPRGPGLGRGGKPRRHGDWRNEANLWARLLILRGLGLGGDRGWRGIGDSGFGLLRLFGPFGGLEALESLQPLGVDQGIDEQAALGRSSGKALPVFGDEGFELVRIFVGEDLGLTADSVCSASSVRSAASRRWSPFSHSELTRVSTNRRRSGAAVEKRSRYSATRVSSWSGSSSPNTGSAFP